MRVFDKQTTIDTLQHWEDIVFDHEDQFQERFCKAKDPEIITRISWWFGGMNLVYVIRSGAHICDDFTMDEWLDWLADIKYRDDKDADSEG